MKILLVLFLFVIPTLSHSVDRFQRKSLCLFASPSFLGRFETSLEGVSCLSCKATVSATAFILKFRFTEPMILKLATLICKLFAKQPWAVCDGISTQFRDEFFYVFRRIGHKSPSEICGILIPDCADPTDPTEAGWEVAIPPKPKRLRKRIQRYDFSQPSHRPLRVLQLSDLHIDFEYKAGTEANCGLPVCCRDGNDVAPQKSAGFWGTVASCDIPFHTFQHMVQYINKNIEVDYIMMSGDYINHVDWKYSKEGHLNVLREIGQVMRENFNTTPVFWAVGNHEGVPVNSFAPHTVDQRFWPTWLYSELANLSRPWIDEEANTTMNYRGSYSTKIMDGLRLISLNTGFCEQTNFFLYINQSDPDQTMSWLVSELFKAELSGEKVHLLAHIPPGNSECLEGWARNYYRVIQRFSSTISAQFFGHVHTDYFTVFYKDMHNISSKPIGVGYAAPSATTFTELNPGFRVYEISLDGKYEILEIENYYADMDLANATHPPDWKLLYKAKRDLKLPDLSPAAWESYIQKLYKDNEAFDQFVRYSYRTDTKSCGLNCREAILCSLRSGHHNNTLYCPSRIAKKNFVDMNRVDF